MARERVRVGDRVLRRLLGARPAGQPIHSRLRRDVPQRELAEAGARGAPVPRVGVVPGADDRRVADPAGILVSPPARGHGGSDVAALVEGDEVDRAELFAGQCVDDRREGRDPGDGRRRLPGLAQPLHPERTRLRREQLGLFRADLASEAPGTRAHEHDVREPLHHGARDADRMEVPGERGDRTRGVARAIHDRGVELHLAEHVRQAAASDAPVLRVGLDQPGARLNGVQSGATPGEDADPGGQRGAAVAARDDRRQRIRPRSDAIRRHGPYPRAAAR